LEHLDYSLSHKREFDYGTWWLAISPDGYSLLLLYTRASAGGNSSHFFCDDCHTAAHPSVVHCGCTVSTYNSGVGCLVFKKDTPQLDLTSSWEMVTGLGEYSLFLE
jgi:hypothetical protein